MACCRKLLCTIVVVLLLGFGGICAIMPEFLTRVMQYPLDYANQKAIDALADEVRSAKIPDQSGDSGHISYSLSSIAIRGFTPPSSNIQLVPDAGLSWSASNAGISLHSDWRVRYKRGWVKASTSGSVEVSVSGVSLSLTVGFGMDTTGKLAMKARHCTCNVGDVSVRVHGKLSSVLNLFRGEVERRVRGIIPGLLCDGTSDQIRSAQNQLGKAQEELTPSLTQFALTVCFILCTFFRLWIFYP
ncbi:bactericidal permeability-increasing protein-like [Babylonia areolata]|uniref:bactericidal permeability-increasing protein-like n=1 Tax=Babylonia areolata TaxID=304850 RepID=UPI003FD52536